MSRLALRSVRDMARPKPVRMISGALLPGRSSAMPYARDWGVSTPVMSRLLALEQHGGGVYHGCQGGPPETDWWRGA